MKGYAMLRIGATGWIEKERPVCGPLDARDVHRTLVRGPHSAIPAERHKSIKTRFLLHLFFEGALNNDRLRHQFVYGTRNL